MEFSEQDLRDTIRHCGGKALVLIQEPKLFKATFDILKSVLKEKPHVLGVVAGIASGSSTLVGKSESASASTKQLVSGGSAALSIFKATMYMAEASRLTSTGAVLAFAGATLVQKTGIAASLVGDSDNRVKCYGAIAELAGNATVTAIVGFGSSGVLVGLTLASLAASALNAYNVCTKQ